jgi:hypothetical protein
MQQQRLQQQQAMQQQQLWAVQQLLMVVPVDVGGQLLLSLMCCYLR